MMLWPTQVADPDSSDAMQELVEPQPRWNEAGDRWDDGKVVAAVIKKEQKFSFALNNPVSKEKKANS